jgi:amino acid adenylation domain-containing protein
MLDDSKATVLLTQGSLVAGLPDHEARVVCLDRDCVEIGRESKENPAHQVRSDNLAYVIFTSGSTGMPKGAMNTHGAIRNRLIWMQDAYRLTDADRVLHKTPFSFDVSVWEFFWPLLAGARLVIARPGGHQDSGYLVKRIAEQKITIIHFVPSMLQVFLEQQDLEACSCLRRVICSGEPLPLELQQRFFAGLDAELHNLYGPTEAAVDVTFWRCRREDTRRSVPIGRPIANTRIYLLDSLLEPVPVGIPGEVHIGGVGLARGYLNRPDLTAEKFIPNPFSDEPGSRLYKTGDLARYLPDGNIEFLGRIDYQVKIRGFRVELGEIETVLADHPGVRQSVALVREDEPGQKRLVAYVVAKQEFSLTTSELRGFLKDKLPEYMIPSAFVTLDALPLTPNGKVNRKALPAPDQSRPEQENPFVPPSTAAEKRIAEIWAQVLKVDRVGIHDNFFDLGGHSLLATQVMSRVRDAFQIELPLRSLFVAPTVAGLGAEVALKKAPQETANVLAELESLSEEQAQLILAQESSKAT